MLLQAIMIQCEFLYTCMYIIIAFIDGQIIQHGHIQVLVKSAVPEGLHQLMVEYADMLVTLKNAKLARKSFCCLKSFLSEFCDNELFEECSSLKEVVKCLKNELKISIFNVDTLTACCKHFVSSTVNESIQKYKELLKSFLSNTSVKEFQCSLQTKITSLDSVESVTLKLDETRSNDTLMALKKLVYHFFGNSCKTLIHCETRPGCVCVTWLVPMSLVPTLRIMAQQHSQDYLIGQGVLELVIGLRIAPNEGLYA